MTDSGQPNPQIPLRRYGGGASAFRSQLAVFFLTPYSLLQFPPQAIVAYMMVHDEAWQVVKGKKRSRS